LRLPADAASPVRYRLELTVVPGQDTFSGIVEIDLQFAKSARALWLNAEKLTLKEATLTMGSEKLAAKVVTVPKDFVGFSFDHPVGPGPATLQVAYQGVVSRKDRQGIFQMQDGDRWYIYSKFERLNVPIADRRIDTKETVCVSVMAAIIGNPRAESPQASQLDSDRSLPPMGRVRTSPEGLARKESALSWGSRAVRQR